VERIPQGNKSRAPGRQFERSHVCGHLLMHAGSIESFRGKVGFSHCQQGRIGSGMDRLQEHRRAGSREFHLDDQEIEWVHVEAREDLGGFECEGRHEPDMM